MVVAARIDLVPSAGGELMGWGGWEEGERGEGERERAMWGDDEVARNKSEGGAFCRRC